MSPDYSSSRAWVETRCTTNTTPKSERIFVGRIVPKEYAGIIRFHKGITLREIIDQTPFKSTTVTVCVLRPNVPASTYLFRGVRPADKPAFKIAPEDMIWLFENSSTPLW